MSESAVDRLLDDIARWRAVLPDAASTYCQGIASKVAKSYEVLLKQAAGQRIKEAALDLVQLLDDVHYGGEARSVERLPLGVVTDLLLNVVAQDEQLSPAVGSDVRIAMRRLVEVRNRVTHELPPDATRRARENSSISWKQWYRASH
jgi:hypothetical protein